MASFGNRLRELRKKSNLTQQELANKFYLNKSSISRYENGTQLPEHDLLEKIADYFKVSIDYLLGRTDVKNIPVSPSENENKGDFKPTLSVKEQEKLDKQAEELVDELTISLSQNKDHLSDRDYEVLRASLKGALQAMTLRNKEKYTPKKYKNKN